jgi:hypothetical protein
MFYEYFGLNFSIMTKVGTPAPLDRYDKSESESIGTLAAAAVGPC